MNSARFIGWSLASVALTGSVFIGASPPTTGGGGQRDAANAAQVLIVGLDYDEARRVLNATDADDPAAALERARLAIYELDCDGAAAILERSELQRTQAGEQLADIARGCQRVTAALAIDTDEARAIEVRWQDEHDRVLAPLLFETVASARDALTRDLKVDWPRPTRIVVVRDLLSLSAMTGLPYKSAQTTGTVAVAKWGRVTLLSPRASRHGYSWRDTVAHELAHLAVTRASRDRAPLWLQEGVAKRQEVRWRDPGPFDDRPPVDAIVARGQERKLVLPLDKLGPSIAMLPSADAAMVAFAEVTSFIRFYVRNEGDDALPRLLAELRAGQEPDAALLAVSGMDLRAWDGRWRAYLAARPAERLPALFGLAADRHATDNLTYLRDRTRLAELLLARNHAVEALSEVDRIEVGASPIAPDQWDRAMADPSILSLRARALEAAGRREEGAPLVADPAQVLSSYAPWWAIRGRWQRLKEDPDDGRRAEHEAAAESSFREATSVDPFDVEAACESIDAGAFPADPAKAMLCAAARATGEPLAD